MTNGHQAYGGVLILVRWTDVYHLEITRTVYNLE